MVLDGAVQAMSHVLDDFICGRPVTKEMVDGAEHVDYNAYLAAAIAMLHNYQNPESSDEAAADDNVSIFGGTP